MLCHLPQHCCSPAACCGSISALGVVLARARLCAFSFLSLYDARLACVLSHLQSDAVVEAS